MTTEFRLQLARLHHGRWRWSEDFTAAQGGYHTPGRLCDSSGLHLVRRCRIHHRFLNDGEQCPVIALSCLSHGVEWQVVDPKTGVHTRIATGEEF